MPSNKGNLFIPLSPISLTQTSASAYLSLGIFTVRSLLHTPVSEFSILSNNYLAILKLSGTIPEASPECTPSVKTSTLRVNKATPLNEVVIHNYS